jgi:membrane-bound ClpP family serine protease
MEWVTLILLLLAGIILIVIEIIFVPGTTILGIIGGGFGCLWCYYWI